jgi:hypothetical protein
VKLIWLKRLRFLARESRSIVHHDESLTRDQYAALLAKAFELVPRRQAADFWLDIQTARFARSRI